MVTHRNARTHQLLCVDWRYKLERVASIIRVEMFEFNMSKLRVSVFVDNQKDAALRAIFCAYVQSSCYETCAKKHAKNRQIQNCKQHRTTVNFCRMRVFQAVFVQVLNSVNTNLVECVSRDVVLTERSFVLVNFNRNSESYGRGFFA